MNAPLFPPRHRRLSQADLDALARRHRAQEAARRRLFESCRTTDTGLLLQRLSRRRLPPAAQVAETRTEDQLAARVGADPAQASVADVQPEPRWPVWRETLAANWHVLPGRDLRAIVAAVLLVPVLAPAVELAVAQLDHPLVTQVELADLCARSVVIRDSTGRPVRFERPAGASGCADVIHAAPFDTATAERIARAIGVLEGRFARRQLTLFGHDLPGLVIGAASTVELRLRGLDRRQLAAMREDGVRLWVPARGSGPILSTFEQLAGAGDPIGDSARKAAFVIASAIYTARHLRNDTARAHFLAERMEVVRVDGAGLGGALAAEALFGHAPQNLGEVCLFAAASGFAVHLVAEDAPTTVRENAKARWARIMGRAQACARDLAANPAEREAARQEIDGFTPPVAPFRTAIDPETVAPLLDALALQRQTLPLDGGTVVLTLDMAQQRQAVAGIRALVDGLPPSPDGDGLSPRRWTIAVAEVENGALPLRVAAASHSFAVFGPYVQRDDAVERLPPDFGLASQHKAILALLAAAHGETRLCNRFSGTIRNVSGPEPVTACEAGEPEGWVDTGAAMAASLNLPWIDIANRYWPELEALETELGLMGPGAGPAAATLGYGRTAPRERFIALFAALAAAQQGGPAGSEGVSLLAGHSFAPIDLEAMGYGGDVARRAASLLSAPLGPDGTLRALAGELERIGCRGVLGKSGTGETGRGEARSRSATVVVDCGPRRFVVLAEIESGGRDLPLGRVTHADIAKLIAAAVTPIAPAVQD